MVTLTCWRTVLECEMQPRHGQVRRTAGQDEWWARTYQVRHPVLTLGANALVNLGRTTSWVCVGSMACVIEGKGPIQSSGWRCREGSSPVLESRRYICIGIDSIEKCSCLNVLLVLLGKARKGRMVEEGPERTGGESDRPVSTRSPQLQSQAEPESPRVIGWTVQTGIFPMGPRPAETANILD